MIINVPCYNNLQAVSLLDKAKIEKIQELVIVIDTDEVLARLERERCQKTSQAKRFILLVVSTEEAQALSALPEKQRKLTGFSPISKEQISESLFAIEHNLVGIYHGLWVICLEKWK